MEGAALDGRERNEAQGYLRLGFTNMKESESESEVAVVSYSLQPHGL